MRKGTKHEENYRGSPTERFWSKVIKTDNCWKWIGAKKDKGYGTMRIDGKNVGAHVFSYILHKGVFPKGIFVCHSCDTPECTNPEHLWLGNNDDNIMDMVSKMRHTYGEKNGQAKLTESDVLRLKAMKKSGYKQSDIARALKISDTTVCQILKGERWKHLV